MLPAVRVNDTDALNEEEGGENDDYIDFDDISGGYSITNCTSTFLSIGWGLVGDYIDFDISGGWGNWNELF